VRAGRAGTGRPAGPPAAATELEARACGPDPVAVIGGADSAAQAALYPAGHGNAVTLIVRGNALAAGMSSHLADRVLAHARITVRTAAEVTALHGGSHLEAITVHTAAPGDDRSDSNQPCRGLSCLAGATPATGWLEDIAVDDDGFVLTGTHLDGALPGATWAELGRRPLPFETGQPLVLAVGDVRSGSMKRAAAAVGGGASATRSVHTAPGSAGP